MRQAASWKAAGEWRSPKYGVWQVSNLLQETGQIVAELEPVTLFQQHSCVRKCLAGSLSAIVAIFSWSSHHAGARSEWSVDLSDTWRAFGDAGAADKPSESGRCVGLESCPPLCPSGGISSWHEPAGYTRLRELLRRWVELGQLIHTFRTPTALANAFPQLEDSVPHLPAKLHFLTKQPDPTVAGCDLGYLAEMTHQRLYELIRGTARPSTALDATSQMPEAQSLMMSLNHSFTSKTRCDLCSVGVFVRHLCLLEVDAMRT